MRSSAKPTAVIATSDDMAISFMSSMRKLGWNLPGDLPIVSLRLPAPGQLS
ncbi:substrate-binding domain-containing protein [Martelella sp. FOR1707]